MSIDLTKKINKIYFEGEVLSSAGIQPSGTINISENGTHDVMNYASANVNVPSGGDYNIRQIIHEDGSCTLVITDAEDGVGSITLLEKTITANGTYNASDDNVDGYSSVTVNVAGSDAGIVSGKYVCRVVDYNGDVLKEQQLNTGDVFELPTPPEHSGLIFREWSSPVVISNNTVVVENSDLIFGATYTTESGLSEFDIELDNTTGLSVLFEMDGTKDWGDGTRDTTTSHTYSDYGHYTIKCDGVSFGTYGLLNQVTEGVNNYYYKEIRLAEGITTIGPYCLSQLHALNAITMPNTMSVIDLNAFSNCWSLKTVIIPNGLTTIGNSAMTTCYMLTNVVLPHSITSIQESAFYNNYSITNITIPRGVTAINTRCFNCCKSLTKITIPSTVTQISSNAFAYCSDVVVYDFSTHVAVPTLANTLAFNNKWYLKTGQTKIIVPDALYDTWIAATNWSTYADCIYKASEVTE